MPGTPSPMQAWYSAQPETRRAGLARELAGAIRDLLDLGDALEAVAAGQPPVEWAALRGAVSQATNEGLEAAGYPYGAQETEALIRALTRPLDGEPLLGSLVEDAAEILALPRQERTEYVDNPLPSPPWKIRKLLLEYGLYARVIDDLVGAFNKGFCAAECDQLPVGCCHILGYDLGLVPDRMLAIQGLEARWQASAGRDWRPLRPREVERKCRYHTDRGCVLARFKSPACIGYLCPALVRDLEARHEGEPLRAFLEALAEFRNRDLDRRLVFGSMERLVETGQALLAAGRDV